ncbi:MAG: hypothetical protein M0P04_12160, partial [Syntrophales bacterium]|nr:hypothetical protein [Syntrophales bacterium]
LFADETGLADPGHNDTTLGLVDQFHGTREISIDLREQIENAFRLDPENLTRLNDSRVCFHVFLNLSVKTALS